MHYRRTLGSYYEFRDNSTNGALPPAAPAPATRLNSPEVGSDLPVVADVRFGTSPSPHLKLLFKGGKNDFYSEGADRIVASNSYEPCYCPVIFTKNYFEFLDYNFDGFLVPACLPNACPNPLKTVPYDGALDDLRTLLNELGNEGKHYGEHSGKRGSATAAVENGMDMDTLKCLGHWRSATIPSKYIDLGTGARIEMSKLLQKRL